MTTRILSIAILVFASLFSTNSVSAQSTSQDVTIIELTQTKGEFFTKELVLKPGKYQFRINNKDVDKELGFVIQKLADQNADVMKTAIPNSFTTALIKKGEAQYTGIVELKVGEYVYSCPLNPTPHYKLTVN